MKIGFDLHGVLNRWPDNLRPVLERLVSDGHDIYVLSGPPLSQLESELAALNLKRGQHFHELFSIAEFLRKHGHEMWQDEHGHWWAGNTDWWSSKGLFCRQEKIEIHIDDSIQYQRFMPEHTDFVLALTLETILDKLPL